ncbi:hypothetical protein ACHAWF_006700 [Thalassiosira exigua]
MDDRTASLTSNFGHSSQELVNLLLTGRATSNVFDHSVQLSDELTCRGVQRRPDVGYLTVLESLRYCEVGGYYKGPRFPIWVVGSASHFSVLFGDEVRDSMRGLCELNELQKRVSATARPFLLRIHTAHVLWIEAFVHKHVVCNVAPVAIHKCLGFFEGVSFVAASPVLTLMPPPTVSLAMPAGEQVGRVAREVPPLVQEG